QAEHLEITFANRLKCGLPTFSMSLAGNDRVAPFVLQRWFLNRFGNGDHARKITKPVEDLASKRILLFSRDVHVGVIGLGQRETKVENVLWIESQVHARQQKKAAHHEASANQQDDRKSNLAKAQPVIEATAASTKLSVNNCWIRRAREAPSVERMAISLSRAVARANKRFATLTQAISSKSRTAASKPYIVFLNPPIRLSSRVCGTIANFSGSGNGPPGFAFW